MLGTNAAFLQLPTTGVRWERADKPRATLQCELLDVRHARHRGQPRGLRGRHDNESPVPDRARGYTGHGHHDRQVRSILAGGGFHLDSSL